MNPAREALGSAAPNPEATWAGFGRPANLRQALAYADNGWAVLPLYELDSDGRCACRRSDCKSPGKHPRTSQGLKDATTDHQRIESYWGSWPYANIGIATGVQSGIVVLDIDPRHGGDSSLNELVSEGDSRILETLTQSTGGGGRHLFFNHWGEKIGNRQDPNPLRPGIDVRGDGGYVVVAPSNHASGARYRWQDFQVDRIADCPDWLRRKLVSPTRSGTDSSPQKWPSSEAQIGPGARHATLVSMAGVLCSKGLKEAEILAALRPYNERRCNPPKPDADLQRIARDIAQRYAPSEGVLTGGLPWPEPASIDEQLPAVKPCTAELLPEALRAAAVDIAERMQVPLDFVAAAFVVTLAGAVNRRAKIQPKAEDSQWRVIPNLWGGIIGTPGVMKSPTIEAVTRPLLAIQAEQTEAAANRQTEYEQISEKYRLEHEEWKKRYKKWLAGGRKGEEPTEPTKPAEPAPAPRYVLTDATFEALHEVMAKNPAGVYLLRDELTGWLAMLDRSGREGERAFCLESWSGTTAYTIDRVGRGTIHVPHCCMSLFGSIQPGRLRAYLKDAIQDGPANDGLTQRLQVLVWPDVKGDWKLVDRSPNEAAVSKVSRMLASLLGLSSSAKDVWRFSEDAQGAFNDWLEHLEKRLRHDELHPAIVSHLSKYRSLMPSLALIFELADRAASGDLQLSSTVSLAHAEQAVAWCEYLESHAMRVYSCVTSPQMAAARELAAKIKARRLGEAFSLRDVYRPQWSGLTTRTLAQQGVEVLIDHDWVRQSGGASGLDRPTGQYSVNPSVWE